MEQERQRWVSVQLLRMSRAVVGRRLPLAAPVIAGDRSHQHAEDKA